MPHQAAILPERKKYNHLRDNTREFSELAAFQTWVPGVLASSVETRSV
jgi:hypothetical protein